MPPVPGLYSKAAPAPISSTQPRCAGSGFSQDADPVAFGQGDSSGMASPLSQRRDVRLLFRFWIQKIPPLCTTSPAGGRGCV